MDSNGFLSHECPSCNQQFKVCPGEGSDHPVSYCPYCGFEGQQCWFTPEQIEHIKAVAISTLLGSELSKLNNQFKNISSNSIKISIKTNVQEPSSPPMETDDELSIIRFPCCNEIVKVNKGSKHFCIICGMEVDMSEVDSKKVFLSHKGVDKDKVREFHKILELLGYKPWLDEDAMPAGAALERAILKGMQDSCGVVFFITPSFKDEGYLESEVNYAIKEKRQKGDKFAIVTLQFPDDGRCGNIPDLLSQYVWKTPKTDLEALYEIIRALPVEPKLVDWRENITGVVTSSILRSKTADLSDEAKLILREAVSGDGAIMVLRTLGGDAIVTSGKSLIPSDDSRTVALWFGGLEDLQRRRYIKDTGYKREMFEVTREGYEAADKLLF